MKILIAGCGGAPSEGVVNSLLLCEKGDEVIGMGSEPDDLILSSAKRKYIIPYACNPHYETELFKILDKEKPDFVHFQNDLEIFKISQIRHKILATGTKLYLPREEVIDTCVHKFKSYLKWEEAGIKVPKNILINQVEDLKRAFSLLADHSGKIWLRSSSIGGGGKGSLPTDNFELARQWIELHQGWGNFVAAEMLTSDTVTWLSIWHEGELVVAQTRSRKGWVHGNRTLSGITGVTKVGCTFADETVNLVAIDAIKSIDDKPHGIYGVDMAYDRNGFPNPTEINIGRFFTTVLFFTVAGLNMPKIYKDIALYNEFPKLKNKINPLPEGLLWVRGMDTKPLLIKESEFNSQLITL